MQSTRQWTRPVCNPAVAAAVTQPQSRLNLFWSLLEFPHFAVSVTKAEYRVQTIDAGDRTTAVSRQVDTRHARRLYIHRTSALSCCGINVGSGKYRTSPNQCFCGLLAGSVAKAIQEYLGSGIPFVVVATALFLLVGTVSKRFSLNILENFQNNHPKASHIHWYSVLEQSKKTI